MYDEVVIVLVKRFVYELSCMYMYILQYNKYFPYGCDIYSIIPPGKFAYHDPKHVTVISDIKRYVGTIRLYICIKYSNIDL